MSLAGERDDPRSHAALPAFAALATGVAARVLFGLPPLLAAALGLTAGGVAFLAEASARVPVAEGPRAEHVPWRYTTTGQRFIQWAVTGSLGVFLAWSVLATVRVATANRTLAAARVQLAGVRGASMPTGFAETCVGLWLAAGQDDGSARAAGEFTANCRPGVDGADLDGQQRNRLQAADVHAFPAPLSYPVDGQPGVYSILVSASLREWGGPSRGWLDRGVNYFRAAVRQDPDGLVALAGLPAQAPPPVSRQQSRVVADLAEADLTDARTAVVAQFLQRRLMRPPAGQPRLGDVGNLVVPGLRVVPVHSGNIASITLLRVGYDTDTGPVVSAVAEVRVEYAGGASSVQMFPLVLQRDAGAWLVADLPGAPPLDQP